MARRPRLITTLADSTFAFACNAYDEVTVAAGFDVNLLAAGDSATCAPRLPPPLIRAGRAGRAAPALTTMWCAINPAIR